MATVVEVRDIQKPPIKEHHSITRNCDEVDPSRESTGGVQCIFPKTLRLLLVCAGLYLHNAKGIRPLGWRLYQLFVIVDLIFQLVIGVVFAIDIFEALLATPSIAGLLLHAATLYWLQCHAQGDFARCFEDEKSLKTWQKSSNKWAGVLFILSFVFWGVSFISVISSDYLGLTSSTDPALVTQGYVLFVGVAPLIVPALFSLFASYGLIYMICGALKRKTAQFVDGMLSNKSVDYQRAAEGVVRIRNSVLDVSRRIAWIIGSGFVIFSVTAILYFAFILFGQTEAVGDIYFFWSLLFVFFALALLIPPAGVTAALNGVESQITGHFVQLGGSEAATPVEGARVSLFVQQLQVMEGRGFQIAGITVSYGAFIKLSYIILSVGVFGWRIGQTGL